MRYAYRITEGWAHNLRFLKDGETPLPEEKIVNGDDLPDINSLHEPGYLLKQKLQVATDAIQNVMDRKAREYGYDNVHTASSYADSDDPTFRREGRSFKKWRESVWIYARSVRDEVLAGKPPFEMLDQFLASAPKFALINDEEVAE